MRLADLHPKFVGAGGDGIYNTDLSTGTLVPAPARTGIGVMFDCPCGCDSRTFIPFANPLDGGPSLDAPGWQRTGESFETLTLTPSIQRVGGCAWHGFITNGEVIKV
jgi:hypothetical protein